MKKLILSTLLIIAATMNSNAQLAKFGLKGGINFASLNGDLGSIDYKNKTGFHIGGVAEIQLSPNFSLQPEAMFSSQGAASDVKGIDDFNFDYISIPVIAKYYFIPDKFSLEVGPQFSFLVNDADKVALNNPKSFDFAVAGGLGVNIGAGVFAQARYTIGLTEVYKDFDAKNAVFQLSVGYMF
ncbi:MAG TPA: porin family protein [Flavobacterium sp.]|nr:porin family protein [Flavobacterium sp.]